MTEWRFGQVFCREKSKYFLDDVEFHWILTDNTVVGIPQFPVKPACNQDRTITIAIDTGILTIQKQIYFPSSCGFSVKITSYFDAVACFRRVSESKN